MIRLALLTLTVLVALSFAVKAIGTAGKGLAAHRDSVNAIINSN